jgi:hypothetical protein
MTIEDQRKKLEKNKASNPMVGHKPVNLEHVSLVSTHLNGIEWVKK